MGVSSLCAVLWYSLCDLWEETGSLRQMLVCTETLPCNQAWHKEVTSPLFNQFPENYCHIRRGWVEPRAVLMGHKSPNHSWGLNPGPMSWQASSLNTTTAGPLYTRTCTNSIHVHNHTILQVHTVSMYISNLTILQVHKLSMYMSNHTTLQVHPRRWVNMIVLYKYTQYSCTWVFIWLIVHICAVTMYISNHDCTRMYSPQVDQ